MTDMISPSMMANLQTIAHALGGVLLIFLGLSFGYKFIQASFMGRVNYWGGLERVHFLFIPLTIFLTPLIVHGKPTDKNLIKTKTAGWVHLFWGPIFFLLSLMMIVAGVDNIAPPIGTNAMNFVLTAGKPYVRPAITYEPPFTYKFPILKKARKTIFKMLTSDIYMDKSKALNVNEQGGQDLRAYSHGKLEEDDDDEDRQEAEAARVRAMQAQSGKK